MAATNSSMETGVWLRHRGEGPPWTGRRSRYHAPFENSDWDARLRIWERRLASACGARTVSIGVAREKRTPVYEGPSIRADPSNTVLTSLRSSGARALFARCSPAASFNTARS